MKMSYKQQLNFTLSRKQKYFHWQSYKWGSKFQNLDSDVRAVLKQLKTWSQPLLGWGRVWIGNFGPYTFVTSAMYCFFSTGVSLLLLSSWKTGMANTYLLTCFLMLLAVACDIHVLCRHILFVQVGCKYVVHEFWLHVWTKYFGIENFVCFLFLLYKCFFNVVRIQFLKSNGIWLYCTLMLLFFVDDADEDDDDMCIIKQENSSVQGT